MYRPPSELAHLRFVGSRLNTDPCGHTQGPKHARLRGVFSLEVTREVWMCPADYPSHEGAAGGAYLAFRDADAGADI